MISAGSVALASSGRDNAIAAEAAYRVQLEAGRETPDDGAERADSAFGVPGEFTSPGRLALAVDLPAGPAVTVLNRQLVTAPPSETYPDGIDLPLGNIQVFIPAPDSQWPRRCRSSPTIPRSSQPWNDPPGQPAGLGPEHCRSAPGGPPAKVWELIEKYEDARWRLVEAEKEAGAVTRWWLLIPIVPLGVSCLGLFLALTAMPVSPMPVSTEEYLVVLAMGLPVLVLLAGAEAWLLRKMLAPRRASKQYRRDLWRRAKKLKRQYKSARSQESSATLDTYNLPALDELTGELASTRREKIDVYEQGMFDLRMRYLLPSSLLAGIALFLTISVCIVVFSEPALLGLLPTIVIVIGLCVWGWWRCVKKFGPLQRARIPRMYEMDYRMKQLESELAHRYGAAELRRQPTAHAQRAWKSFSFLPEPRKMLLTLPDGTSRFRLWFHRNIGWGVVAAVGLGCCLLLIYTALS